MENSFYRNSAFTLLILLTSLVLSQFALAAQIQLVWEAGTEPDLKGYNVYYGTASGTYGPPKNVGNVTSYPLTGLIEGQIYYIVIKAYDTSNNESDSSNEASGPAIKPPVQVTQVSPSGTGTDTTPTYTWNAVPEAVWYYLYVNDSTGNKIQKWYSAVEAGCPDGAGTCLVTPTTEVVGSSTWWVQSSNSAGYGPWSTPLSFTIPAPVAATLISPSGTIPDTTPTYTWNAVSNSTWYCLNVNDSTGNKIQQWYTAAALGCGSGTGSCSVTPTTEVLGSCQWSIRTYNTVGLGPWSASLSFSTPVPTVPPVAATLVSPSGTNSDTTPPYTWNAVPNSTWYCLYVNDSTGNKINEWFRTADVCSAGTCSVTPTTEVLDSCQWWVRTYNSAGFGPWSPWLSFTTTTTPPSPATLVSPVGNISDTRPTYTWNAVSNAKWYCLYVNDSTGNKINEWFRAADVCSAGTCSVTPTTEVLGSCQWWVRTYNIAGFGQWSGGQSFTFPPPPTAVTQIWPSGTITDSTPAYIWNAVSGATWYQLYVNDSTGKRIQKWFTASEVGCGAGTGTCSVKPTTALGAGSGQWWVQTYDSGGFGPWSLPGRSFTVYP